MGRKAGMYINPKTLGGLSKPCVKEMIGFLNCISHGNNDDGKCVRQKELLNTCIDQSTKKNRQGWGSINHHLRKLSAGRK